MPWKRSSGAPMKRAERPHEHRREQRDAEDHHDHRRARAARAAAEPPAPPNSPASSNASPSAMTADDDEQPLAAHAARAPGVSASRIASTGSTCVARRAGHQARDERGDHADHQADDHRARRDHRAGRGQVDAERRQQRAQPRREHARPARIPSTEATKPISERLDDHGVEHLPARRAERAQQRELARALRDGDGERVEDQEAADEHGDAGEHEQRRS